MGLTIVLRWENFVSTQTAHLLSHIPQLFLQIQIILGPEVLGKVGDAPNSSLPQQQTKAKTWNQGPTVCPSRYYFWYHDSLVTLGHILSISQKSSFSSLVKWCKLCKFKGNLDACSLCSWAFQSPIIPPLALYSCFLWQEMPSGPQVPFQIHFIDRL